MPLRAFLRAAILALALLPAGGALTALADDGRPPDATGHPPSPIPVPRSELRPSAIHPASTKAPTSVDMPGAAGLPKKELVIFVGGYGSSAGDGAFDQLKNEFADGHYDVVRFGADPPFRYDTYDAIDRSADALIDEIRALGPGYSAVNIVSHSMGGVVVDRAFDKGLGAGDGVVTDIAIAGPHSGAFFAAVPTETFPLIGGVKDIVRDVAMTVAGSQGQFELNVRMPMIARNILDQIKLLTNASLALAERCVEGIEPNRDVLERNAESTPAIATALNPYIGYDKGTEIVQEAVKSKRTIREVAREKGVDDETLDKALDLRAMAHPHDG